MNVDKLLSQASINAGLFTDGRSLHGLPISTSEAKKRREAGQVFINSDCQWRKANLFEEDDFPIYLRFGKHKYFCITSTMDSIFIQSAQDPFMVLDCYQYPLAIDEWDTIKSNDPDWYATQHTPINYT